MLGELLGGHDEQDIEIFSEFTEKLDFQQMKLDEGLRYFLSLFVLPGES